MEFRPKLQDAMASNSGSGNQSCAVIGGGAATPTRACQSASPPFGQPPSPAASEANPFPTTFVQADTSSFKQVVQILTGSAETAAAAAAAAAPASPSSQKSPIPPAAKATGPKKPAFKLYERRNTLKNMKMINPLLPTYLDSNPNSPVAAAPAAFSPRQLPEVLSPSTLNFPSLSLSPVTPLISDPFERRPPAPGSDAARRAEDRAIAEKGFYLHPSPRSGRGGSEPPQLLPLFPVMPPKAAAESSSATFN